MSEEEKIENESHLQELIARFEQEQKNGNFSYYDAEDLDDLCRHYGTHGYIEKAKQVIELFEKLHPDDEELEYLKITLLIEQMRYQEALDMIDQKGAADDTYLHYFRVLALLHLDRYDEAGKEAIKTMDCESDNEFVCQDVAQLLFSHGMFEKSLECLLRAEKIDDTNEETLLNIGRCYMHLHKYEDALRYIDRLLDKNPYLVEAWQTKATLHMDMDKAEDALDDLEYALAILPNDEGLRFAKIKTLIMLKRDDEALEELDVLEKEQPHLQGIVEMNRGDVYFWQREYKLAHKHFKRGYDPEYFAIDSTMHFMDCKLILHKWKEAVQLGNYLNKILPNNVDVLEKLADAYYELKDVDKSLRLIRKCTRLYPDDTHFQMRLGSLYLDVNQPKRAYNVFRKIRTVEPDNVLVNIMLAVTSYFNADIRKMYRYLMEAEKVDPEIRDGFYKLCPNAKEMVEKIDEILHKGRDMGVEEPEKIVLGRAKL